MNIVVREYIDQRKDLLGIPWQVLWRVDLGQHAQHRFVHWKVTDEPPRADCRDEAIAAFKRVRLLRRCRVPLTFEFVRP